MSDKSKPEFPSMPLEQVMDAADELPQGSKLHRALVLLVTKVDRGFASILYYMRSLKGHASSNGKLIDDHEVRIRTLEQVVSELQTWRNADQRLDEARDRENSAKHELAVLKGRTEIEEKERVDRWKELDKKWKIAIVAGACTVLAALVTGLFKLAELVIPLLFGSDGGS